MSNGEKCRREIMSKVRNVDWDIMSNGELWPRLQQGQGAQQEGHGGSVAKLDGELQQHESQTFSPIRHFVPFDVLSHTAYYPFDVFSSRCFILFDLLSQSTFFPFVVVSHSAFCPSTFFIVGVFYFDILSVNRPMCVIITNIM
jgi:hypothetical protein